MSELDILIIEFDGLERTGHFVRKIRSSNITLPVVVACDKGREREAITLLQEGATDCRIGDDLDSEDIFRLAIQAVSPPETESGYSIPRAFYATLLNNFPNGVVSYLDRELRFLLTQGQGLEEIGYDAWDLVGRTIHEVHGDQPWFEELWVLCQAALSGKSGRIELIVRNRFRTVHALPVKEGSGATRGVILVSQDITPWKMAEAELNLSKNRLSGIVDSAMDAIITVDEFQTVQFFNPSAERMFGYSAGQVIGGPLEKLIPERFRPDHKWHVSSFGATGQTNRQMGALGAVSGLRANGEEFPIEASISQVKLEGQTLYTVILRDISARRQAERELARTQADLREANESLEQRVRERTEALAEANEELLANEARLMHANNTFTALAGLRATSQDEVDECLARIVEEGCAIMEVDRCGIWLFNEERTVLNSRAQFRRSGGKGSGSVILPTDRPEYFGEMLTGPAIFARRQNPADPNGVTTESALVARLTLGGQCVGVLKSEHQGGPREWKAEDETFAGTLAALCSLTLESFERSNAEGALRRAKEEAERARDAAQQADVAKSEFLSRMSHELRTPLNSILGFAQIMEMQALETKQANRVGHILKAGRHLLRLVDEVLDIARVESGRLALSPEPVALAIAIESALDLLRPLFQETNLNVLFDPEHCRETFVQADQGRLSQVLLNLLSNAAKYNRPSGKIVLSVLEDEGEVQIQVRDTGHGIPEDKLGRLFQPFDRLGAEGGPVQGTGLGLALSRRLIEAMGGSMGASSVSDEGSTFWFKLPRAKSPLADGVALQPRERLPFSVGGRFTLLYIEDNLANLQVIEDVLDGRDELTVISAMQGQLGLDLARRHRPGLILLDLHLPDIPGEEVLRRLQDDSATRDIPVVVITADASPNLGQRLKASGAREYLTKPLDVRQFLEVIHNILTGQAST